MRRPWPGVEIVLLSALVGVTAFVLGLISIERRSLWMDEALDIGWTDLAWSDYIRVAFQNEGSQVLYLLLLKPWIALTSADEWTVRLPSVVFAAAAAALLVPLASRLFHSRLVGVGAGALLATNAFSVSWSQQVRTYTLAMLLAVVVTFLFVEALESESWGWWLAYGVVAGISIYAHFFVGLVLVSHLPALVTSRRRKAVWRWAAAATIAFVIALPALDFVLHHDTGQVSWIPELEYAYLKDVLYEVSGESRLVLVVGLAGFVALLTGAVRHAAESWRYVLVASWLVTPLVLTLVISVFKPMLLDRYLIVAVPALALASAYALTRMGPWVGSAALLVLLVVSLSHVRDWYGSLIEQDWRGAVEHAERERQPDEPLLAYPGWLTPAVEYYANAPPDSSEVLSGERAWVISVSDRAAEIEEWAAAAGYAVEERRGFVSVEVWELEKADGG